MLCRANVKLGGNTVSIFVHFSFDFSPVCTNVIKICLLHIPGMYKPYLLRVKKKKKKVYPAK